MNKDLGDVLLVLGLSLSWIPIYYGVALPTDKGTKAIAKRLNLKREYQEKYHNKEIEEKPTFWNIYNLDKKYTKEINSC